VIVVPSEDAIHPDAEYLVSIRHDKLSGQYLVTSRDSPYAHSSSRKLWSVIRENHPKYGARLMEGDVVKLGRFKLRVRQICLSDIDSDDNTSCSSYGGLDNKLTPRIEDEEKVCGNFPDLRIGSINSAIAPGFDFNMAEAEPCFKQLQCRICLSEGPAEGDPLICPCECTGSIGYVHSDCIGRWLKGKLGLENHNGSAFFYRPVACELCHATYPAYWSSTGGSTMTPIAFLPECRPPFIVFENIGGSMAVPAWNNDNTNTFPHGLHIVNLAAPSCIKIGRGHDCDMRISDVSISRVHALIRLGDDGNVYILDQKSKFGTLMAIDKAGSTTVVPPSGISAGRQVSLQCGRTVLSFVAVSSCPSVDGDVDSVHSTFNDGSEMVDDDTGADDVPQEGQILSPDANSH
jgi:hypothetical protein